MIHTKWLPRLTASGCLLVLLLLVYSQAIEPDIVSAVDSSGAPTTKWNHNTQTSPAADTDTWMTRASVPTARERLGTAVDQVREKHGFGSLLTVREKMLESVYRFEKNRGFVLKTASLTK